jgi:hypothetical protein
MVVGVRRSDRHQNKDLLNKAPNFLVPVWMKEFLFVSVSKECEGRRLCDEQSDESVGHFRVRRPGSFYRM